MKGSLESIIERLSVHYLRSGKEVTRTSNVGLIVMVWSVAHHRNAKSCDLRKLFMQIGGSRTLRGIDRKEISRYISATRRHIHGSDLLLLQSRYCRLGYTLWCRGYGISSYSAYLRSLNHFVYCSRLSSLGLHEINEVIRKIKKMPKKKGYERRQAINRYPRLDRR